MARTLVGRLQLIVQAMGLGEAKKVESAITSIERSAKRLSSAAWGQNFERQIHKMALSARELDQVRRSWDSLQKDIAGRGLTAALKKSEISAWKTATLGHFAQVRSGLKQTEAEARRFSKSIQNALKPAYVMLGGYTGVYLTGVLGREAIGASAERQREYFRQRMGDIPQGEQDQIFNRSQQLSQKYPSVNITDIMEMARTARNTMGSTERGMEVLDRMVQGFVTLQSAKGVEAATSELTGLMKGLDNLGSNSNGAQGVKNVNTLIDAFIKAAQIEGNDFDVGSMWSFARRSRIAGPGLSPEFLATVAPAMIQDMGADGAGTALAMAYKAFVIGANDGASKGNIAEQQRLGLRSGEGKGNLVDSDLFGTNPYAWVKKNLIPALQKDGVDTGNDTAVAKAVAGLSRNSSATGFLTRMITQQQQNDRLIALYQRAMGTDAADHARDEDPFVGYKGFQESLRNLSAAVGETVMPVIVPALNGLANTINSFASMVQSGDPRLLSTAGALGVGAAAAYGTWKVAAGIYGLITAGASLQTAATMLQAAAAAQGGGAVPGGAAAAGSAGWLAALGLTGSTGLWATLVNGLGDTPGGTFNQQVANQRQARLGLRQMLGLGSGNPTHSQEHERDESLYGTMFPSPMRQGGMASLGNDFEKMLSDMDKLNSTSATPTVDTGSLDAAMAKANALIATLRQIGAAASSAASSVDAQVRRAHSDFGVVP
ncbi:MAG: hypothetical protein EOS72_03010 [Mesorhizobium sp.]|uniref:hypothetical protein n=1 Tax=Mesorhizobium sp. TaxID=1871066 RepID=UPI000FEA80D8|nr:hypothetical protein [Mesorhizobium sp.]RWC91641.1 MAG: hypothetical protein EOS72_03010 [Mesorhizobium sp.]